VLILFLCDSFAAVRASSFALLPIVHRGIITAETAGIVYGLGNGPFTTR
jgi:hypothetical protein